MISSNINNMDNESKNKNEQDGGFIRIIILLLIILVIINFLGISPTKLWTEIIVPTITFIWGILVWLASFLTELITDGWQLGEKVIEMIKSLRK